MRPEVIHTAEFTCRECGAVAGRVSVVPSPTGTRNRLVLSVFIEMWEEMSKDGTYADAIAAIDAGDARALWKGWFEWAPFYCPECDACYCSDHWRQWMEFDEGFYDYTQGVCPRGHERMLLD
ncbi:MAG TPA: hypothetical protein VF092_23465 [Longimicrobium sp.]